MAAARAANTLNARPNLERKCVDFDIRPFFLIVKWWTSTDGAPA